MITAEHTQCEDCGKCRVIAGEEWCGECEYFSCEHGPDCADAVPFRVIHCPECKIIGDHTWWCGVGAKENDARPTGKKHYYWRD